MGRITKLWQAQDMNFKMYCEIMNEDIELSHAEAMYGIGAITEVLHGFKENLKLMLDTIVAGEDDMIEERREYLETIKLMNIMSRNLALYLDIASRQIENDLSD